MSQTAKIFASVAILVVLILAAAYLLYRAGDRELPEQVTQYSLYQNATLGFEVEVPENWAAKAIDLSGVYFVSPETQAIFDQIMNDPEFAGEGPAVELRILRFALGRETIQEMASHIGDCYPNNCPEIDTPEEYAKLIDPDFKVVTLAGVTAYRFVNLGLYTADTIFVLRDEVLYVVSIEREAGVSEEVIGHIHSSFKFIN